MKNKMTVTQGAAIITEVAEKWLESDTEASIFTVTVRKARSLSKDKAFNLAAHLKYNFGASLDGQTDADWLTNAREILRIVK